MYSVRIVLISAALILGLTGCDPEQEEKIERAGEHFEEAVKHAGDVALDAAEKAGDKVQQWTDQGASDREAKGAERPNREQQQPSPESSDSPR
jgi:hypothetical protein